MGISRFVIRAKAGIQSDGGIRLLGPGDYYQPKIQQAGSYVRIHSKAHAFPAVVKYDLSLPVLAPKM